VALVFALIIGMEAAGADAENAPLAVVRERIADVKKQE